MGVPAYKSAGDGPATILLLHGIGGNRDSFDDLLPALPAGWRGVAWDMPGYGGSPPLDAMTFPALADAAVALLDRLGVARAVVLGHSMGGMVAQEMAVRAPERLAGLVLFATTPAFGGRDDAFRDAFLAARLEPLDVGLSPADLAEELIGDLFGADAPAAVRARAAASMAAIPADAYRAAVHCLVTFDRRDALGAIACPTLILAAENDALAPPKTMRRMAERIPGARYVCLPGAGHLANFEAPTAFNRAVSDFLPSIG